MLLDCFSGVLKQAMHQKKHSFISKVIFYVGNTAVKSDIHSLLYKLSSGAMTKCKQLDSSVFQWRCVFHLSLFPRM